MKYPLEALEAVSKIVDDPDTAAEVLQELDAHGLRVIQKPDTPEGKRRVARLVSRMVFLEQQIDDHPTDFSAYGGYRRGEASSLRYSLELLGVDVSTPYAINELLAYLTNGEKKRGNASITRFRNENACALS